MHEPGRIYKVFVWRTDDFLFETDDLHKIIRTSQKRKDRLLCISSSHQWEVYPGGRNILTERAILTPGAKERAEQLYNQNKERIRP